MIGEIYYWRDMAKILDAINKEVNFPFVELTLQVLAAKDDDKALQEDLKKFTTEKSRVVKGTKEAKWNQKYLKIIEQPVKTIE